MKLIKGVPEISNMPAVFMSDKYTEKTASHLLAKVEAYAKEALKVVLEAFKEEWKYHPSAKIKGVFGHWLVNSSRHLRAAIILCNEYDLSIVANVHHRQIFEIFLQVKYYANLTQNEKEEKADILSIIGSIEFLEKMKGLQDSDNIEKSYKEITAYLARYDKELVDNIKKKRKNSKYNWFDRSFNQLAKDMGNKDQDLKVAYQIISADIHGTWDYLFDVKHFEPGVIDLRGYPDRTTLFIRAAETLYQVTNLFITLWNEIARSVGAEEVFYT